MTNMITKANATMSLAAKKRLFAVLAAVLVVGCSMCTMMVFASNEVKLDDVTSPIIDLVKNVTRVLIPLVGVVGSVFCISLGVKFAKAEEPQEREKAKQHLKNAIIGFVLIFVLIVALDRLAPFMTQWMDDNTFNSTASTAATAAAN